MIQLFSVLFVMTQAFTGVAIASTSTVSGKSSIYYTNAGPKELAESRMWNKAFQLCSGVQEAVRVSEVRSQVLWDAEGRPTAVEASAEFDCVVN